jgi:hypothetical protein
MVIGGIFNSETTDGSTEYMQIADFNDNICTNSIAKEQLQENVGF